MKSMQLSEYGDASALINNDVELRKLQAGEVLVEVYAASLNPFDSMIAKGYVQEMIPLTLPATIGGDIAGVVADVADDVTTVKIGDRVFGQAMAPASTGALAEYAITSAGNLAHIADEVSFEQAASLPLAGVSAVQALNQMDLSAGKKLFINGGSGGIGVIAIQIAKSLGAYVAVTANSKYSDDLLALGADEVIDYKSDNFTEKLSGYDAVLDNAKSDFDSLASIVKEGAVIVSLTGTVNEDEAEKRAIKGVNQYTQLTHEALDQLMKYVADGSVKPQIGATFVLDDASKAFKTLDGSSTFGKIVISVKSE